MTEKDPEPTPQVFSLAASGLKVCSMAASGLRVFSMAASGLKVTDAKKMDVRDANSTLKTRGPDHDGHSR